jgi:hypothetical protein
MSLVQFRSGQRLTAALLNAMVDEINAIDSSWLDANILLTASSVNPTNYTPTCTYKQIGKTTTALFQITAGGAFTAGTGTYSISTPVIGVPSQGTSGYVRMFDSSAGFAHFGRVALNTTTTFGIQSTATFGGTLSNVGNTFPWVWAAGDIMDGIIIFETP